MGGADFSGVPPLRVAADKEAMIPLGEATEEDGRSLGLAGEENVGKEGRSPSSLCSEL